MTVTLRSMMANAARSPLIDGVDDEENRLCGASSWSLHTNCWSLCAKERGGGAVMIVAASMTTKTMSWRGATTLADDDGRRHHPPRADADEDGMSSSSNSIEAFVDSIFRTRTAPAATLIFPSRAPTMSI